MSDEPTKDIVEKEVYEAVLKEMKKSVKIVKVTSRN